MTAIRGRLRAIPSWQVTLSVALLALGFLIAAQLAAEGPRVRYTTQERSTLVETALGLQGQQDALKARILDLRDQIGRLEASGAGSQSLVQQLNAELDKARIAGGLIPLGGPGVVFKLEDADIPANAADSLVTASDVRLLVDELWLAGAEAISVNGERVTGSTAILDIGGSLLANSAYLAPPYEIRAIGPAGLYARVQQSPTFVEFVGRRVERQGVRLGVAEPPEVAIPAFAGTVTVRFGHAVPAASTGP